MCPAYAVPGSIRIYGSDRINELSRVRATRLNTSILLQISASDAAVVASCELPPAPGWTPSRKSIFCAWRLDGSKPKRFCAGTSLRYMQTLRLGLRIPLSDLTEIVIRLARPPIPYAARSIFQALPLPVRPAWRVREWE